MQIVQIATKNSSYIYNKGSSQAIYITRDCAKFHLKQKNSASQVLKFQRRTATNSKIAARINKLRSRVYKLRLRIGNGQGFRVYGILQYALAKNLAR